MLNLKIIDNDIIHIISPQLPPLAVVFAAVSISASSLYCIWLVKKPLAPLLLREEGR